MKNILLILGLFITANCNSQNDSRVNPELIISRDFPEFLDTVVQNVIYECSELWGLGYYTLFIDIKPNNRIYSFKNNTNAAITKKNVITFDSAFISQISPMSGVSMKTFIFVLRHEYFHTLAGDSVDMSIHNVSINNSLARSVYFQGLNIFFGNNLCLNLFDEASAEYMAWSVDSLRPEISVYGSIGSLINYAISNGWISKIDLLKAQKESNVLLFASKFFGKEASMSDVAVLYNIFVEANNVDIKQSIKKIKDLRSNPY